MKSPLRLFIYQVLVSIYLSKKPVIYVYFLDFFILVFDDGLLLSFVKMFITLSIVKVYLIIMLHIRFECFLGSFIFPLSPIDLFKQSKSIFQRPVELFIGGKPKFRFSGFDDFLESIF